MGLARVVPMLLVRPTSLCLLAFMTEPKTANSLGLTLLRAAALATSIGLGGYLVVQAQERANQVPESAEGPGVRLDEPQSPGGASVELEVMGDPFPKNGSAPTFLYSSKILQTESVSPLINSRGYEFPSVAKSEAVFLGTSKSASLPKSGFFFDEEEVLTLKPQTPFLYSSKSVQIVLPLSEQPTTTVEQADVKRKGSGEAKGQATKPNKDA